MEKRVKQLTILISLFFLSLTVFSQNPAAEWRMDECQWTGTAGEVVDSQGNGYDGTAINGATTAAGKLCNSGVFDGSSSYVSMANSNFGFGNRMSVAAWVKWNIDPATGQNYANIISINSTSQTDTGQFWLQHDNNNQHFQFAVTTTNARYFVNSTTSPVQDVWYHVVGVYDRNRIRIYVNGSKEGEKNTTGDVAAYNSAYKLTIARWAYTGFPRAFSGQLDEVKVYTQRLRDNDVQNLYNRENSGKNYDNSTRICPVCQALAEWRMDECFWSGTAGEVRTAPETAMTGQQPEPPHR
ncbi:MAG: LamG domain-containing protein [Acidobacteria bacterium]|nr:LamG domain-containing protein [Acidobacteriota bacterium]